VHHADDMMARITAERLVRHLEASGFVLMKGPPRAAPTTGGMPPGGMMLPKENPTAEAAGELRSREKPARAGEVPSGDDQFGTKAARPFNGIDLMPTCAGRITDSVKSLMAAA
jgi:hypothetical protein